MNMFRQFSAIGAFPVLTRALTRFRLPWHWDGQPAVIQSRAVDETGYVQPTLAELLAVRGVNSFTTTMQSGPGTSQLTAR
jgi:hypothetical protein